MVDIPREGRGETQGACTLPAWPGLGLGTQRAEGAPHPGRVRPSSSWLPEPLRRGRHKKQAQLFVLGFCGTPEGWNRAAQGMLHIEQPGA